MIDHMPPLTAGDMARGAAAVPRKFGRMLVEHGRTSEFGAALVQLFFAITLSLPGDTLAGGPAYAGFRNLGVEESFLTLVLGVMGALRIGALYVNGAVRRSPELRAICAVFGCGLFVSLGVAFGWAWLTGAPDAPTGLGTATGTYFALAIVELISVYRTGADARATRDH